MLRPHRSNAIQHLVITDYPLGIGRLACLARCALVSAVPQNHERDFCIHSFGLKSLVPSWSEPFAASTLTTSDSGGGACRLRGKLDAPKIFEPFLAYAVIVIRPRQGGAGFKYTIPIAALAKLSQVNKELDPRGRYDAVMASVGLFQIEPAP
jgi:hypothetical protein